MQRNANVGSKLLALIAVPAVVLVAVASLGASQRLDVADQAQQTEDGARLAAASTAYVHELQLERLLTMRLVQGDDEVLDALAEQRADTDEAAAAFVAPRAAVGDGSVASRFEASVRQIETISDLRPSIDEGNAAPDVAIDAYTTAIDAFLELDASLASRSGLPELSATLTDSLVLSRAKEARALRAARIAGIAVVGQYRTGDYAALADLEAEEERQFARLAESQDADLTTSVRNALATPEARDADALLEEVMDEGVIGGSGEPGVAPQAWQESATAWLDSVRAAEAGALDTTIATADTAAFDADKTARLYLIGTAAAVILSILLASLLARRINRRLQRLTTAANQLANEELPRLVEELRMPGEQGAEAEPVTPLEVDSGDEIGQLAEAFNAIQEVTSKVAEEQAALLRRGIADIFVNLARRNQSLLDRQIEFIDGLEAQEQDPDQLENLFKLDHLATRMRRNAESLLVLAGAEPPRRRARPVDLADVVRVAIGEVEDFTRINLLSLEETTIGGNAAVDLAHLLSELMENATQFSPPDSTVEVVGQRTPDGGYGISVADRGIGMSAEQLAEANALLAAPPPVGLALSRSLGFIVVGRLARRLRVSVRLTASPAGGITALVDVPAAVLSGATEQPGPAAAAPPPGPQLVDDPRPLIGADGQFPPAGPLADTPLTDSSLADVPSPPTDSPLADVPSSLADALPAGEEFERGLASLVEPGTDSSSAAADDEVNRTFWGEPADAGVDDVFADLAAPDEPETLPGPEMPSEPEREAPFMPQRPQPAADAAPAPAEATPAWEPAPDWLDGELASVEGPTAPSTDEPLPAPPPGPSPAPAGANPPLARRQPRATLTEEPASTDAPANGTTRTASTRRSPEEVRAMLSRYRRGLEDGRQSPGSED